MVVDRVKEFHKLYPSGTIQTEIIATPDTSRIIVKATVDCRYDVNSKYVNKTFTGHSQAEWGKGMMGDVALEIAETSAIGRALGFANIGLLDGIASADEIRKVSKKVKVGDLPEDDDLGF